MSLNEEHILHEQSLDHLFEAYFNTDVKDKIILSPHGSNRAIIRLQSEDGHSAIGIHNHNIFENKAFIEFTNHFESCKLHVPKIYGISLDLKTYLTEDLGNTTLFESIQNKKHNFDEQVKFYYINAIEDLQRFQIEAGPHLDYSYCYQFTKFDRDNIIFDIQYFKDRFLNKFHHSNKYNSKLDKDINELITELIKFPPSYFLYRDFQSRNIMIKNEHLFYIDYQSGRKGPLQYDLASLLFDAKADLPQPFREELLKHYIDVLPESVNINSDVFIKSFWYFAIIRILQALGAYGFLSMVRGKKQFLESIPFAINNLRTILTEKLNNKFNYLLNIIEETDYESAKD